MKMIRILNTLNSIVIWEGSYSIWTKEILNIQESKTNNNMLSLNFLKSNSKKKREVKGRSQNIHETIWWKKGMNIVVMSNNYKS